MHCTERRRLMLKWMVFAPGALLDQISQLAWRALCFISLAVKRGFVFIGQPAAMATLTDSFFQSSFLKGFGAVVRAGPLLAPNANTRYL
jgi:hypothetical protein